MDELIELVNRAEKVRLSQELAYLVKDPEQLPSGTVTGHSLYESPYIETDITAAYTFVYLLDYFVDGVWVLGQDLETKYGNIWK